ncbi:MAG: T9SS type A sorting domain-containing protein [Ignavibacteria bacterium]
MKDSNSLFHKIFLPVCILILIFSVFIFIKKDKSEKENIPKESAPKESTQGKDDNPYEASEFRYEMLSTTKDSKGKDIDIYKLRMEAIDYTQQNLQLDNNNSGISWFQIGPGNIGGRIRSIIIHPTTPSLILIGAVAGGVWKSTNSGDNWLPKMEIDDPCSIGCMLMDKTDPSVVYAGSGEGWGNGDAVYGGGIYKSADFGETWTKLPSTFAGGAFHSFRNVLQLSQDDAGNVYAATKNSYTKHGGGDYTTAGGLFKSTNAGSTWTKISSPFFADNYFNPTDVHAYTSSVILYAVNKNGATYGGIYKTTTGGATWTKILAGLPPTGYKRIAFAKDPSSDDIYAVFQSEDESSGGDAGLKGIFKSTDMGSTWSSVASPPKITSTGMLSYLGKQGWYDNVIAIDPFSASKIYAGGIDLMKTTNSGTNWSQLTYWHAFYGTPVVHADHHVIAFDPSTPGKIYSGNDGGIYRSTDDGVSWTSLNNGLFITQFYSGATYKTGPAAIYGGTQDNGHLKFSTFTTWTSVFGGDGGYSAQSQTDPLTSYEEYVNLDISKTTDGGSTWFPATSGLTDATLGSECLFIAPFSMSEISSSVLIAGSNEVWLTTDGAGSWTGVGGGVPSGEFISAVTVLGVSAPFIGFAGSTVGKIYKCVSLDPGLGTSNTWAEITPPPTNGSWVRRIVVKPGEPEKIIACYSGYNIVPPFADKHIWKTSNGGANWTDISVTLPNVPVHSVIHDPIELLTLYAGTETGIYRSTDEGTTWSTFTFGMPSYVPVDELVLQKESGILMAFTHGRSVFATDVPLPVELASFSSEVSANNVKLNWTTSNEFNNSGFGIERKLSDQSEWKNLSFVPGFGTSNGLNQYSYLDRNLNTGKYDYRLKQIDYNGNYQYYGLDNEAVIGTPLQFYLSQNYPNPFNPSTKISYEVPADGIISVKVFDIIGKEILTLVNEFKPAGYYTEIFNGSNFPSGVYFYKVVAGEFVGVKKMIMVK